MIVLGIETATAVCSVGLTDGEVVLSEVSEEAGRRHSVVLVGMIEQVLMDAGYSRGQLEGVAVSAGPGSFTGLRIGMGLAKGICVSLDIPIATVSTLEALAVQSGSASSIVCGCLDARHEELYSGVYQSDGATLKSAHPDASRGVEPLISLLAPEAIVVGYEIGSYTDAFCQAGFAVMPDVRPSGGAVATIGERRLASGHQVSVDGAEPNYCKKSQPERLRAKDQS